MTDINYFFHELARQGQEITQHKEHTGMMQKADYLISRVKNKHLIQQEKDALLIEVAILLGLDTDPRFQNFFNNY